MLRLIMRRGPTPGAIYELTADVYTIGRGAKNDIVIRDNDVSREHCRLTRLMDDYEVQDTNSTTGTYVNGQRVVTKFRLEHGSILELGEMVTFEVQRVDAAQSGAEAVSPPPTYAPRAPELSFSEDAPTRGRKLEQAVDFRASLVMTHGLQAGQTFPLTDLIITIGRDLANDIVIQDPEISRRHARLRRGEQGYLIEDVGSTNGTSVNGQAVTEPRLLHSNDQLRLGTRVQFQYVQDGLQDFAPRESAIAPPPVPTDPRIARGDTLDLIFDPRYRKIVQGALIDHIFIAYAREEWDTLVAPLTLNLQDAGLKIWADQHLAQDTEEWRLAVEQALYECWVMVLMATPKALEMPYVKMQYRIFVQQGKPLVALLCDDAKLPPSLAGRQAIAYNPSSARESCHRLVSALMQLRP